MNNFIEMKSQNNLLGERILLNTLLNSLDCLVVLLDVKGMIVEFNKTSERISGFYFEEVKNENFLDKFIFAGDRSIVKTCFENLFIGNEIKSKYQVAFNSKSGQKKIITWNNTLIELEEGDSYILCIGYDYTDKKAADDIERNQYEKETKYSHEKYKKWVEEAPDAVFLFDAEHKKILDLNERACALFKMNREELLNIKPKFLTLEQQPGGIHYREQSYRFINEALEGKNPVFEWTYIDANGEQIPTEVCLTRLPSKKKVFIRASIINISERKKSEFAINEFIRQQSKILGKMKSKEASLSALINSTSDLIFSINKNFRLVEFNHAFKASIKRNFGVDLFKGIDFKQFIYDKVLEAALSNYDKAFNGELVKDITDYIDKNGNRRILSAIYSPIISDNEIINSVVVTVRDITESKLAEQKIMDINKQMADYKLMALRSVMNPHFLFNSLNSIQYFIAKYERKNALDYLSIFSSLIRKILDSSVNQKVNLSTEIEILKNYIELEKLRFDNRFDFEINIHGNVDVNVIEIPSLIIQPYVENAILHGLYNLPTRGTLKIDIAIEKEYLVFVVEDNGIGRKKSQEINNQQKIKERSYGMSLTQARLDMINKTIDVSVVIDDLFHQNEIAAGTKVKIYIKL